MRKMLIKTAVLILIVAVMLLSVCVPAFADSAYDAYNYDSWGNPVDAPDGFVVKNVFGREKEFALDTPTDMYFTNKTLYVLDAGKGCVVMYDENNAFKGVISEFFTLENGQKTPTVLNQPQGIFVTADGRIFIADTDNFRVIVCKADGEIVMTLTRPETANFSKELDFKPVKIVVDDLDNVYVLAEGFYYGAVVYDKNGNYTNFFGASRVKVTASLLADMFWRKFMTDKQLDYTQNYLPAAFTSFDIDKNQFIYTCISEKEGSIRKLNSLGTDIFVPEQGPDPLDKSVYGDRVNQWYNNTLYVTSIKDITVTDDDLVYVLDKTKCRIFEYDKDSNLLNIFGASGNQKGTFMTPVALETIGENVLVLDQDKANITVFTPTDYGKAVHEATVLYHNGLFEEARDKWQSVLSANANIEIAYRGIGRAYLQTGDYEKAMYYAKLGQDRLGYSKAMRLYRSDVARKYFVFAVIVLAVVIVIGIILKKNLGAIKNKLGIKERKKRLFAIGNILLHPVDFYERLYYDKSTDSLVKSSVVVALFFVGKIISSLASGFIFNQNNITEFNIFFIIAQTLGLVAIWVLSEKVVGSLRFGHGNVRTIYNGAAAALIPYTATIYINLILSQFLVYEEKSIMTVISAIGLLYTVFLLYQAVRLLQRYNVLEAAFAMLLDVFVAIVVILLLIIVYMLIRQIVIFASTVFQEIMFRIG